MTTINKTLLHHDVSDIPDKTLNKLSNKIFKSRERGVAAIQHLAEKVLGDDGAAEYFASGDAAISDRYRKLLEGENTRLKKNLPKSDIFWPPFFVGLTICTLLLVIVMSYPTPDQGSLFALKCLAFAMAMSVGGTIAAFIFALENSTDLDRYKGLKAKQKMRGLADERTLETFINDSGKLIALSDTAIYVWDGNRLGETVFAIQYDAVGYVYSSIFDGAVSTKIFSRTGDLIAELATPIQLGGDYSTPNILVDAIERKLETLSAG